MAGAGERSEPNEAGGPGGEISASWTESVAALQTVRKGFLLY